MNKLLYIFLIITLTSCAALKMPKYKGQDKLTANIAQKSLTSGDYQTASTLYEQLHRKYDDSYTYNKLLEVYAKTNETNKIVQLSDELISSKNYSMALKAGNILLESGSPQKAANIYQQLIAIKPRRAKYHSNYIVALNYMGQHDKAISYAQEILPDFSRDVSILNNLAVSHMLKGDFYKAEEILTQIKSKRSKQKIRNNLELAQSIQQGER